MKHLIGEVDTLSGINYLWGKPDHYEPFLNDPKNFSMHAVCTQYALNTKVYSEQINPTNWQRMLLLAILALEVLAVVTAVELGMSLDLLVIAVSSSTEHGATAGPKGTQSVTQAVMLDAENQNGDQMLQPSDVCAVTGGGRQL